MSYLKPFLALAGSTMALSITGSATAQSQPNQERLGQILGALLGQSNSVDAQWLRGARPLNGGRSQFYTRLEGDVRAGAISSNEANRVRAEYDALVTLESRYAADGRFSTQERADLSERYSALTQQQGESAPRDVDNDDSSVANGRAEFNARVTAALTARRITRTEATRLRSEYATLIEAEATYGRNGISAQERADLDRRLDELDERLADGPSTNTRPLSARERLADIQAAIAAGERSSTLDRNEAAEIRVQHGDLTRLEAAYSRTSPSSDDSGYLARRIGELEALARQGRR